MTNAQAIAVLQAELAELTELLRLFPHITKEPKRITELKHLIEVLERTK